MARNLALSFLIFIISNTISAKSLYMTYLNQFFPFYTEESTEMHLNDKALCIENQYADNLIVVDSLSTGHNKFRFYIRIANLNNEETKSYECVDRNTNKKKSIKNPSCGIIWNYKDSANYYAVTTHCSNSDLHSFYDTRNMTIDITKVENGKTSLLKSVVLQENVNLQNGYNVIDIEYDGNSTYIAIGDKELRQIAELKNIDYYATAQKYGVIIGAAAKIDIERIVLFTDPIMEEKLATRWTRQSLDTYLASATNVYEGYWNFFDKELEEDKLKIGGRYTIALIKNNNGFDIIYINGANVNGANWKCGMLKGKLTKTMFVDNYDLIWYDAMMKPFEYDVYATFENHSVLTLFFPAQGSSLRFAKQF